MTATTHPTLLVTPVRAALGLGTAVPVDLVARIQVPALKGKVKERPSLNLAIVIDVSGSMAGAPLADAAAAAAVMVGNLTARDRVAIVAYDTATETVLASMPALQAQEQIAGALARMHSGGGTDIHAGWIKGAELIAPHTKEYGVSRVILLSDGDANAGQRDPDIFGRETASLAEAGVGTSTYGIGLHFKEALMTRMAADGQAFYAANADALMTYFDNEFSLMSRIAGRRVRLLATARIDGVSVPITNLNDHTKQDDGWVLPNLLNGAETWVALSFEAPALKKGTDVRVDITVSWVDEAGTRHSKTHHETLEVKAKASKKEDTWAADRVREARAAAIQREAAAKASRGDWAGVNHSVGVLRGMSANNAYIAGVAHTLGGLAASCNANGFSKEATYASHTMSNRQTLTDEDATFLGADVLGLRKGAQGASAPKGTTGAT